MLCLPGPENPYRYDGDFQVSGLPILIKQEGGAVMRPQLVLAFVQCTTLP